MRLAGGYTDTRATGKWSIGLSDSRAISRRGKRRTQSGRPNAWWHHALSEQIV